MHITLSLQAEMASEQSSEKQSGALLGGYKEGDADSPDAQEAAKFAVEQLSQQSNSLLPMQLKKVRMEGSGHRQGLFWGNAVHLHSNFIIHCTVHAF